jgi:peptidoglycan/LPS O-acetylase OafA/YrhL
MFPAPLSKSSGGNGGFRPDIEGLRGVAILLVVLFHARVPLGGAGFVGVDVFFVLSGYLITGLLGRELEASGRIRLREFWARRIRRLIPAAAVCLLICFIVLMWVWPQFVWYRPSQDLRWATRYLSNFLFIHRANNYFEADYLESPFLHTWSLAVEEQFYLAWPLLAYGVFAIVKDRRRATSWALAACVVLFSASFMIGWWRASRGAPDAFYGLHSRAWEFALGASTQLVFRTRSIGTRAANLLSILAVGLMVAGLATIGERSAIPGPTLLFPTISTSLLLASGGAPAAASVRLLSNGPLRFLGKISYSWYLWHWPPLVIFHARDPDAGPARMLWSSAVGLGAAIVSYYVVEHPLRTSPRMTRSYVLTYGVAVASVVAGTLVGYVAMIPGLFPADPMTARLQAAQSDKSRYEGCEALINGRPNPQCVVGDVEAQRTVLALGDSHAMHWMPGLSEAASRAHLRVVYLGRSSCHPALVERLHQGVFMEECRDWHRALPAAIKAVMPVLVIAFSGSHAIPSLTAEDGAPLQDSERRTAWARGTRALLEMMRDLKIPTLLVHDTPLFETNPLECIASQRRVEPCQQPVAAATQSAAMGAAEEDQAIAEVHFGESLDPIPLLCPKGTCLLELAGKLIYADNQHLTATFARGQSTFFDAPLARLVGDATTSVAPP